MYWLLLLVLVCVCVCVRTYRAFTCLCVYCLTLYYSSFHSLVVFQDKQLFEYANAFESKGQVGATKIQWAEFATAIGRTNRECVERWRVFRHHAMKSGPFTNEEVSEYTVCIVCLLVYVWTRTYVFVLTYRAVFFMSVFSIFY